MNSKAASAFLNKQTHLKVLYFLEHFLAKLVGQFGHSTTTTTLQERQLCEKQLMNGQRRLLLFPQNPFLCADESDRNGGEGLERQTVTDFTCRSINQHVPRAKTSKSVKFPTGFIQDLISFKINRVSKTLAFKV